jgi:hypothetical protein
MKSRVSWMSSMIYAGRSGPTTCATDWFHVPRQLARILRTALNVVIP